jgi:ElaA protein
MKPGVEADCFAIGRVVTAKRGCGLGRLILTEDIAYAEDEYDASRVYLEAQTYARGFYEKLGFRQVSEEFTVDGIPHIGMIRESAEK